MVVKPIGVRAGATGVRGGVGGTRTLGASDVAECVCGGAGLFADSDCGSNRPFSKSVRSMNDRKSTAPRGGGSGPWLGPGLTMTALGEMRVKTVQKRAQVEDTFPVPTGLRLSRPMT